MNIKSKKALAMMVVSGGLAAAVAGTTPTLASCGACGTKKKVLCVRREKGLRRCGACSAKK